METFDEKITWKEKIAERITCALLTTLVLELIFLVTLIVFIYNDSSSQFLFYIFSILVLMIGTIYFAWHSLVKENAFELLAFMIISSILSFHGIYQTIKHSNYMTLTIASILVLSISQAFYFFSFYFAYKRFTHRITNDLQTQKIKEKAFKLYETFVSVIKVDFLLYTLTAGTFVYYILADWSSFKVGGLILCGVFYFVMICYSFVGILATTREQMKVLLAFLILTPICLGIKLYFLIVIAMSPGDAVDRFALIQICVVVAVDIFVAAGLVYMGYIGYQRGKVGLMSLIRAASDDAIKSPFI